MVSSIKIFGRNGSRSVISVLSQSFFDKVLLQYIASLKQNEPNDVYVFSYKLYVKIKDKILDLSTGSMDILYANNKLYKIINTETQTIFEKVKMKNIYPKNGTLRIKMTSFIHNEGNITVQISAVDNIVCTIKINNKDTILTLKRKISHELKISINNIILTFKGTELNNDEEKLSKTCIVSGSIINLFLKALTPGYIEFGISDYLGIEKDPQLISLCPTITIDALTKTYVFFVNKSLFKKRLLKSIMKIETDTEVCQEELKELLRYPRLLNCLSKDKLHSFIEQTIK